MIKGPNLSKDTFKKKRGERIFLPTNSLRYNGFESLDDLDSTPLYLVSGVHKSAAHGDYLPISMVRAIISVNKYFTLDQSYPGLLSMVYLDDVSLELYMSSWAYLKQTRILTCDQKIAFDGYPDSWPVFRIELTGIIIQRGLFQLYSPTSSKIDGKTPPHENFQSVWMEMVLKMTVNNLSLRWPMHEGNMDGILLQAWLKVRYEIAAKLDPRKRIYREKIWSLKMKDDGLIVKHIDRFQVLEILQRKFDQTIKPEGRSVNQMVKHIEYPLFSGPCKVIKNQDTDRHTFRESTVNLRAYKISKMTAQNKRAIDNEINRLLLGKRSNNKRANGEAKALSALKLGEQ